MSIPKQISCIKLAIQKLHPDWTVTPQSNAFKEFKLFSIILKEPEELSRQEQSSRLFEPNPEVSEDQYDRGPHLPATQTRPRSHSNRSQHNTNPVISSISSSKLDADEYFLYFKLHYTPETSSYIKSKHKKIFAKFNVLLVNILIQELSHNYKQRIFLLRSQQNYISLSELKGNDFRRSEIQHFIIRVIQFFGKILETNKQTKIRIRINKHTIFLSENKDLKLGDYNLFFHHFRERDQEMKMYSEDYLMGKMVELIYYISNKNEENQFDFAEEGNARVNKGRVVRRVLELQEIERTTAQKIIYSFVEERKINHQEIDEYFREQYHSQSTETIREHNENLDITTRSQISLPLNFSISHDQPAQSFQTSINKKIKKYKNKKPWKIIPIVILVLLALCVVGLLTFLVWRDRECEEHEYKEGGGCYECDESCKMCERGDAESCTECGRDEWLLVKRQEDRVGKCSEECMGVKDQKNKHCIVQLAEREERKERGNISWET